VFFNVLLLDWLLLPGSLLQLDDLSFGVVLFLLVFNERLQVQLQVVAFSPALLPTDSFKYVFSILQLFNRVVSFQGDDLPDLSGCLRIQLYLSLLLLLPFILNR